MAFIARATAADVMPASVDGIRRCGLGRSGRWEVRAQYLAIHRKSPRGLDRRIREERRPSFGGPKLGRESTNPSRAGFYMHVPGRTMTGEGACRCQSADRETPRRQKADSRYFYHICCSVATLTLYAIVLITLAH